MSSQERKDKKKLKSLFKENEKSAGSSEHNSSKNPNSSSPSSKKKKSTDGDSKKKSVTIKAEPVDQKPLQLENQNANYNGKSILKEQQEEKKVISP